MAEELKQQRLVKEHFDKVSTTWSSLYSGALSFYNYNFIIRKKHVLDLLDSSYDRVLDAGCGTGDFITELLERGQDVYAIDFAKEMVQQASRRVASDERRSRVHFSVGDVCKLDFEDNFFDAIIGVGLIEYLTDVEVALSEMCRVLKPGGSVVVTVPNLASPFMAFETFVPKSKRLVKRALALAGLRKLEPEFLHRHFFPWKLDNQLNGCGLKKTGYAFCTYGLSSERFNNLSLSLSKHLDRFAHTPWGVLGTNYIVKAQKLGS